MLQQCAQFLPFTAAGGDPPPLVVLQRVRCLTCACDSVCLECARTCHAGHVRAAQLPPSHAAERLHDGSTSAARECDCSLSSRCALRPPVSERYPLLTALAVRCGRSLPYHAAAADSRKVTAADAPLPPHVATRWLLACAQWLLMADGAQPHRGAGAWARGRADRDGLVACGRIVEAVHAVHCLVQARAETLTHTNAALAQLARALPACPAFRAAKLNSSRVSIRPRHPFAHLQLAAAADAMNACVRVHDHTHARGAAEDSGADASGNGAQMFPRVGDPTCWPLGTKPLDRVLDPCVCVLVAAIRRTDTPLPSTACMRLLLQLVMGQCTCSDGGERESGQAVPHVHLASCVDVLVRAAADDAARAAVEPEATREEPDDVETGFDFEVDMLAARDVHPAPDKRSAEDAGLTEFSRRAMQQRQRGVDTAARGSSMAVEVQPDSARMTVPATDAATAVSEQYVEDQSQLHAAVRQLATGLRTEQAASGSHRYLLVKPVSRPSSSNLHSRVFNMREVMKRARLLHGPARDHAPPPDEHHHSVEIESYEVVILVLAIVELEGGRHMVRQRVVVDVAAVCEDATRNGVSAVPGNVLSICHDLWKGPCPDVVSGARVCAAAAGASSESVLRVETLAMVNLLTACPHVPKMTVAAAADVMWMERSLQIFLVNVKIDVEVLLDEAVLHSMPAVARDAYSHAAAHKAAATAILERSGRRMRAADVTNRYAPTPSAAFVTMEHRWAECVPVAVDRLARSSAVDCALNCTIAALDAAAHEGSHQAQLRAQLSALRVAPFDPFHGGCLSMPLMHLPWYAASA